MLRKLINNCLEGMIVNRESVAVLCSGGMDSLSVILSCLDLNIKPTLYTFYLKSFPSPDLFSSRKIAETFGLSLVEVVIEDADVNQLIKDVAHIIERFNVKKKTAIQCIYPFLYVAPKVKEDVVITGLCADDLYGTPRSMAKHQSSWDVFQGIRQSKVDDPKSSAYQYIKELFEVEGKQFVAPYKESKAITEYMQGLTFKEMHSPKQKMPAYLPYQDEIEKHELYRRNSNLQCGSMVREWHDKLMKTKLNPNNAKTIVTVYNAMHRAMAEGRLDQMVNEAIQ